MPKRINFKQLIKLPEKTLYCNDNICIYEKSSFAGDEEWIPKFSDTHDNMRTLNEDNMINILNDDEYLILRYLMGDGRYGDRDNLICSLFNIMKDIIFIDILERKENSSFYLDHFLKISKDIIEDLGKDVSLLEDKVDLLKKTFNIEEDKNESS